MWLVFEKASSFRRLPPKITEAPVSTLLYPLSKIVVFPSCPNLIKLN
jgi:hypothetical protein